MREAGCLGTFGQRRHGVRIGTAEVHRALIEVPEIDDSLIGNLDIPGGGFFMPLFVKLKDTMRLDVALIETIRACMRKAYSARHVPDTIYQVRAVPYTLTGKNGSARGPNSKGSASRKGRESCGHVQYVVVGLFSRKCGPAVGLSIVRPDLRRVLGDYHVRRVWRCRALAAPIT